MNDAVMPTCPSATASRRAAGSRWWATGTATGDTVGFYDPAGSLFHLRNSHSGGEDDLVFGFGTAAAGWTPLVGTWQSSPSPARASMVTGGSWPIPQAVDQLDLGSLLAPALSRDLEAGHNGSCARPAQRRSISSWPDTRETHRRQGGWIALKRGPRGKLPFLFLRDSVIMIPSSGERRAPCFALLSFQVTLRFAFRRPS